MKPRSKKGSKKGGKKRSRQVASKTESALDVLERQRAPFSTLVERVVQTIAKRFIADGAEGLPMLEVGGGAGQLYRWMPESLRHRMILTDISLDFVHDLQKRFPEVRAERADAAQLPFGDAKLANVLGLCVFDVLPDPRQAVREMARVLAPGGRFVHFLDLGTSLAPVFLRLVTEGKVPLPNFFDPHTRGHGLSPLTDLLGVERSSLDFVLRLLERARHPSALQLAAYARSFQAPGFNATQAARSYVQWMSNAQHSHQYKQLFWGLHQVVTQPSFRGQVPWSLEPVQSFEHFHERLLHEFSASGAFTLEFDELVKARTWVPPSDPHLPPGCTYHARFMSIEHCLPVPLEAEVGVPLEALTGTGQAPEAASLEAPCQREIVVHAFVASRR